jgi:multidrug efflux pump subunit AcrA (membrane-fusion protein)
MANEINKIEEELQEVEENPKSRVPLMVAAALVLVIGGGIGALAFLAVSNQRVYIENSNIEAPSIPLAATADGTLQQVYVAVGDMIPANSVVAEVGTQLIQSQDSLFRATQISEVRLPQARLS